MTYNPDEASHIVDTANAAYSAYLEELNKKIEGEALRKAELLHALVKHDLDGRMFSKITSVGTGASMTAWVNIEDDNGRTLCAVFSRDQWLNFKTFAKLFSQPGDSEIEKMLK